MTAVLTKQFRVFRGPSAVVTAIGPNVLALAGFDGMHTGHRALLRRAAEAAAERGLPAVPPPSTIRSSLAAMVTRRSRH
jgi:hypothetical protein